MRLEEWLVSDSRLDDQQYEIFMSEPDNSSVVAGNAGSGKTVLAVHRAKRMSQLGSFVLLVFNKALKTMIESGFLAQGISTDAAIYAWAWENRGMDLSGLAFFPVKYIDDKKYFQNDTVYLQKGKQTDVYKRVEYTRKAYYDGLYAQYLKEFKTMSRPEAALAEAAIASFVSIDFSDYVDGDLWRAYGRRSQYYERSTTVDSTSLNFTDRKRFESLSSAVLYIPYKFKRDFITLDEAQDFNSGQIQSLTGDYTRSIVFFGDTSQKLSSNGVSINEISAVTGLKVTELQKNYRVTKEIARLSETLLPIDERTLVARCNKSWGNPLPVVHQCQTIDEQISYLINIIKTEDLTDVAILVPTNKLVEQVSKKMQELGMDTQYRYNRPLGGFPEGSQDFMFGEHGGGLYNQIDILNFQSTLPCVLTYHSSKGTQFETVFIPFANDSMHHAGLKRNPLYVAMTRASKDLYLLYEGKLTALFDLVPSSYYRKL